MPFPRCFLSAPLLGISLLSLSLSTGCSSFLFDRDWKYVHPTVAVFKFENRAQLKGQWEIGNGMADQLVSRLKDTGRFVMLERRDLDALLGEHQLQDSGLTRREEKVAPRRVKNANYLIKGVVHDFSHVGAANLGIFYFPYLVRGGGRVAKVSMVVTVIEVETGEIILSKEVSKHVYAGHVDFEGLYENVAFGGDVFYATPLGKATKKAMDKAVKRIVDLIGKTRWEPVISAVRGNRVVLNGGRDRKVKRGTMFHVFEPGETVIDPVTGNFLGQEPGRAVGLVMVDNVFDKFAYASLLGGRLGEVGHRLKRLTSRERGAYKAQMRERREDLVQPAPPVPMPETFETLPEPTEF